MDTNYIDTVTLDELKDRENTFSLIKLKDGRIRLYVNYATESFVMHREYTFVESEDKSVGERAEKGEIIILKLDTSIH